MHELAGTTPSALNPAAALLAGVKVIDFAPLLPGPFGTVILADLGADVIKIEPTQGDFARKMPLDIFRMANRNKRGLALDLKNPRSAEVVERLTRWADVAVEGFRPGVAERIGIGPKRLRAIRPELVYCSVSGFGQTGPWRDRPGHEIIYLATGGGLNFLGNFDDTAPRRSGLPVADLTGSTFAAISILAALLRARQTGEGATLDVSLSEAVMALAQTRRGLDTDDQGRSWLWPTNDVFETADGRSVVIGVIEPHFWTALVAAMVELEPAIADARFDDEPSRRRHGQDLFALLKRGFRRKPAAEWLAVFEALDVPGALVENPREASTNAQASARGLVRELDGERHLPFPLMVDEAPAGRLDRIAPAIGADGRSVLHELGYGDREIDGLADAGAVSLPASERVGA